MIEPYAFPRPANPITPSEAARRQPTPAQRAVFDAAVEKINDLLIGVRPGESYWLESDYYPLPSGLREAVLDVFRAVGWIIAPYHGQRVIEFKSPEPRPSDSTNEKMQESKEAVESAKPKTRGQEVAEKYTGMRANGVDLISPGGERWWIEASGFDGPPICESIRKWVADLIDSERADAAKEEREACAKVAEHYRENTCLHRLASHAVRNVADAIRRRCEVKP